MNPLKGLEKSAPLLGSYKRRGQEHLTWGRCVICRQSTHQNMEREELLDLTLRQNREREERGEERAVATRLGNPSVEPSECCSWNMNLSWACSACKRDECKSNAVSCLIKGSGLSQYARVPGGSGL